MEIIEQNTSDSDLVTAIKKAVKHKQPLSVIRCGDGEMHILKNVDDFPGEQQKLTHHHSLCLIQWRENIWRCKTHAPANPAAIAPPPNTFPKSPESLSLSGAFSLDFFQLLTAGAN